MLNSGVSVILLVTMCTNRPAMEWSLGRRCMGGRLSSQGSSVPLRGANACAQVFVHMYLRVTCDSVLEDVALQLVFKMCMVRQLIRSMPKDIRSTPNHLLTLHKIKIA